MSETVNISGSAAAHEMHGHGAGTAKDSWLHNAEATASLLIALGGLIATCQAHAVLPETPVAHWIEDCLVPFQLPVFYFCLGYLYQRYRTVRTRRAWAANLKRELALMLIPFAAFTVLELLANTVTGVSPGFSVAEVARALFVSPIAPVGYFYTCLIIYALTPTLASRRNASCLLIGAAAAKITLVTLESLPATAAFAASLPYAITSVADNGIWVAAGMALALYRGLPLLRGREKTWGLGGLWLAASIITYAAGWIGEPAHVVLDALGIAWFASLFSTVFRNGRTNRFFAFVTRYTMAIWLFHAICLKLYFWALAIVGVPLSAAPWLMGLGALVACYGLPVALMGALSHIGRTGIIVYPARYLPPAPTVILRKSSR
ncbi:hypothetical protein [uncultured Adlercreutzia sp.]|uniref:hypothetical protein n=1 Tax=uncultured Adlercreutzia sp. TaxID=875803 RepID=UPI0025FFD813|nr:hypothetical protein [uncultured Adlercreutzia sp.]